MVEMKKVEGEDKGKILLYALSTCVWCKKTKKLLNDLGVEYFYVFVDKLEGEDLEEVKREIKKFNSRISFPTVVIDEDKTIVGFKKDEIKEALKVR